jgi:hypothetical protein
MESKTQELYALLVKELTKEPGVTFPVQEPGERKSFGTNALHVNDKIFCMVDSRARFVVKLPATQVQSLLADGRGAPFEMGKAKWAKEWVVLVEGTENDWPSRAREALSFVRGLTKKK